MHLYQFGGKDKSGKSGGAVKVAVDPLCELVKTDGGPVVKVKDDAFEPYSAAIRKAAAERDQALDQVRSNQSTISRIQADLAALELANAQQKNAWWNGIFWGVLMSALVWLAVEWLR